MIFEATLKFELRVTFEGLNDPTRYFISSAW